MIDQKFIDFIDSHHVLTLSSCAGNQPYSCSCFYAYDKEHNIFVVKTHEDTRHTREIMQNGLVSLAIVLETDEIGKIQGLQATGKAIFHEGDTLKEATRTYLKRFPYAAMTMGKILVIEPDFLKLTDNRFGFGKKLIWDKEKK